MALFTREAEEARPAGRWRRRGRGRAGGAAAAAPACLLLQAGRRGARRRPGCGPGIRVEGGQSGGRKARAGRARGGTCCLGPCAPGRPPLFSSWRSRRRRAAPRRSRARPLRTDGAVSGPCPGPGPAAASPPALPRPGAQRGAGATSVPALQVLSRLQQDQQGVQLHPPARPCAPGRRRPLPGPLRPAPLAACPARPAAPLPRLPRTPCALGRHPPPLVLKLTLMGERRPAQPMGASTRASGADVGPSQANRNRPNASGRAENVDRCDARLG